MIISIKRTLLLPACMILCLMFSGSLAAPAAPKIELLDENSEPVNGTLWIDCNLGFKVYLNSATAIEWKPGRFSGKKA